MLLRARILTLIVACLAIALPAVHVAAQQLRPAQQLSPAQPTGSTRSTASTLKLVAQPSDVRVESADASLPKISDEAPDLSPQAPAVPALGDDIVEKPFAQSVPQLQRGQQAVREEPDTVYQEGPYGPTGPGAHLQRHADRLRNYIDNRPRQMPLTSESWLNKPYGLSYLVGGLWLDDPLHGVVGGNAGITYGGRFSWDFAPSFGIETRLGGADVGIVDRIGGTDLAAANIFYADINWLWYFTGDTRWRPYVLVGSGVFDIDFNDAQPVRYHQMLLQLPIGLGLKYRHTSRLAMRVDLVDNIAFSSGQLDTMHNWSLTAGIEARFGGGRKRNYWPWNPSREWW